MSSFSSFRRRHGYTLIEMVVVLTVLAIILTLIVPSALRSSNAAQYSLSTSMAATLDGAKNIYYAQAGSSAEANWTANATDDLKYTLLSQSRCLPSSMPGTWSDVQSLVSPHVLVLNDLFVRVSIDGSTSY
jgi:prepilin-type N-terminal cleavage/methylation domain-containing protein